MFADRRWYGRFGHFMSGLQPSVLPRHVTQGFALGWDMAAPLALNEGSMCFDTLVRDARGTQIMQLWRRTNTGVSPLRCAPVEMTDLGVRKESGRMELTGHLRGNVVARWGRAVELRSIPHPELGRREGEPIQGFLHCAALRSK